MDIKDPTISDLIPIGLTLAPDACVRSLNLEATKRYPDHRRANANRSWILRENRFTPRSRNLGLKRHDHTLVLCIGKRGDAHRTTVPSILSTCLNFKLSTAPSRLLNLCQDLGAVSSATSLSLRGW